MYSCPTALRFFVGRCIFRLTSCGCKGARSFTNIFTLLSAERQGAARHGTCARAPALHPPYAHASIVSTVSCLMLASFLLRSLLPPPVSPQVLSLFLFLWLFPLFLGVLDKRACRTILLRRSTTPWILRWARRLSLSLRRRKRHRSVASVLWWTFRLDSLLQL